MARGKYLTYAEEMHLKYPDRPYVTWETWVLKNMIKALSMMGWLNTPEETQRLEDAKNELKARRKEGRK